MKNNINSDREKIAARLKEARTLSGLSQAQAADKMNLTRPTISEIESGKRKVSADELIQFANLYRVDTSWLLHEELDSDLKFAARELSKLSQEDREKLLAIMKIFPKKNK
jgi:transcriptional regulator with XRE-family HTH domain